MWTRLFFEFSDPKEEHSSLLPQMYKLGHQDSQRQWRKSRWWFSPFIQHPELPLISSRVFSVEVDAWRVGQRSDLGVPLLLVKPLNSSHLLRGPWCPQSCAFQGAALWGQSVRFLPPLCSSRLASKSLLTRYLLSSFQNFVHISPSLLPLSF